MSRKVHINGDGKT